MKLERITFRSREGLQLEGLIYHFGDGQRRPAVVVCHPHPLYGGSMHSSLVATIARTLAERGFIALRFNFRGVGKSEGRHEGGLGEEQDVAGAVETLLARDDVDPQHLYLAGWSFGAWVGLNYGAKDPRLAGLAAVGLPTAWLREDLLAGDTRPKLFLTGEHDTISEPEKLQRWAAGLAGPVRVVILEGTDHFLAGREREGAQHIADFFAELVEKEG